MEQNQQEKFREQLKEAAKPLIKTKTVQEETKVEDLSNVELTDGPTEFGDAATGSPVEGDTLELCLIIDCTGSMGSWIQRAKDSLIDIINNILSVWTNCTVKITVVAYRDIQDINIRFDVMPFNTDV